MRFTYIHCCVRICMSYAYYKKNLRHHKNASNMMLDIAVSLCNKNYKKFACFKYFSLIKKILFSNVNLASDSLKIAASDSCLLSIDL